jgi:hypothetical protein
VRVKTKCYWPLINNLQIAGRVLQGEQTELALNLPGTYTVVGFYLDNDQIWIQHVTGKDAKEAAKNAVGTLTMGVPDKEQVPGSEDTSGIEVVAVFLGDAPELLGLKKVTNSEDL